MGVFGQTWTLTKKNLLIVAWRQWFSTVIRAILLPIGFILLISYVRLFFLPPSIYGFGEPRPIRDPASAFAAQSGRDRVVIVDNGFAGGQIQQACDDLSQVYNDAGAEVHVVSSPSDLSTWCRSSLTGSSRCYGAVSFLHSPTEGNADNWDYTVYTDFSLGQRLHVGQDDNDAELFALPFVGAIDAAIARASGQQLPETMFEYPFTSETFQEREDEVQSLFMGALVNYLGLVLFIGVCGISYHLPGHVARERELGMSALIDTMNPQKYQWLSHAARIFSANSAFGIIYLPGYIAIAAIIGTRIFLRSDTGAQIAFHILICMSLASYSTFAASFFPKAQLSGITIVIASCLLAVIAQLAVPSTQAAVAALSIIFPPINYVMFSLYLAAWERNLVGADFNQAAPSGPGVLPGWFYFAAAAVQIVGYPTLTLLAERLLYGTASSSRTTDKNLQEGPFAVRLQHFSKTYRPSWLARITPWKRAETVHAVSDLSFTTLRGQLVAMLGKNGSGKTTTLSAITAQERFSSGLIELDGTGGLGLCPQKNVQWDELTVYEHVRIFNELKAKSRDSKTALRQAVEACDLQQKVDSKSKTLSGGQRRKLQLAMAFTGGSRVCCVDEASSGLDPVSRRKIWDILLAERGARTILFTTHALDEADALSDHIILLESGKLVLEGSAVELKQRHGGDYQIVLQSPLDTDIAAGQDIRYESRGSSHIYHISTVQSVGPFVEGLEKLGIHDYEVNGPTIEQVFLRQAEKDPEFSAILAEPDRLESEDTSTISETDPSSTKAQEVAANEGLAPLPESRAIGFVGQLAVLFCKRLRILPRNYLPYAFGLVVPIIAAILTTNFLTSFERADCSPDALAFTPRTADVPSVAIFWGLDIPAAPASRFDPQRFLSVTGPYGGFPPSALAALNTYGEWDNYIHQRFRSVAPGGVFLGNETSNNVTMSYKINDGLYFGAITKSVIDAYLMDLPIFARFSNFALPISGSTGDSLQLVIYFGLAMSIFPGLFALYPSYERIRKIRDLQYSNGVRPAPLWLAHILFDAMFVVVISTAALAVFVTGRSEDWYAAGHLWPVFFFFGLASTLFSYVVSLFASTQLGTFAFAVGYQAVSLLLYFFDTNLGRYLLLVAYSIADDLQTNLNTVQYILGLIMPAGNLMRTLLLALNQSQLLCRDQQYRKPSDIQVYGSPIIYLVLQCAALYTFLVCYDSGYFYRFRPYVLGWLRLRSRRNDEEDTVKYQPPMDVMQETERTVSSPGDALRVMHLSKSFTPGRLAVSDLTFGVRSSEVYALLGPNAGGKTTTISLIRGELKPTEGFTPQTSEIVINGHSLRTKRADALLSLGVCPQFDAIDMLSVRQHLGFYARAAGIPSREVKRTVTYIMQAVGLTQYANRMAANLSGGNKRKLSLAIAVVGNPKVLLLDEPSSGMDAVAKRVMWKALKAVKNLGRDRSMAMVITSHSMEEVAALCDRVSIMRRHMLAVGEKGDLIRRYGDRYHVHLMLRREVVGEKQAELRVRHWIEENVARAVIEREMLHGQLRFWVPRTSGKEAALGGLAHVFRLLEENKVALAIEYYSVVQTNLEDVFLNVVGREET
ncbi:uncharacterized protein HMPREF1541_03691 [Cyphellophora europaea CBS 101466]|uniref:ABC transporter domain-containing protein n=1 Tax=Cyphellophora europaea (strain CBS 101466) TaxID=1220924 RepID=W2S1A7_CYPE1|nr:uncharacterized protein HMPREF1541_03691 [Cyphellophora europaea CBS 101466]ETN41754.1 hypothetical protein HMPREF1541_03691 [Cyphellophora europaea CBS 101466]